VKKTFYSEKYSLNTLSGLLTGMILLILSQSLSGSIQSAQSGNWSSPSTWVGGSVPGPSDDVTITANHTITVDVPVVISQLTMSTGTLQGSQSFTVNGNVTMSGGWYGLVGTNSISGNVTITGGSFDHGSGTRSVNIAGNLTMSNGYLGYGAGTGSITVGGDFTFTGGQIGQTTTSLGPVTINGNTLISGTALKSIYGRNLVINNSGTWSGGDIHVTTNGKLTVASGATLNVDLSAAKSLYESNGYTQSSLDNFGTIQLNGTALMNLSLYQGLLFNNSGQVMINGGELRLASTNNQTGCGYQISGGSVLNLAKGTVNALNADMISASGNWTLTLSGATVNVTGGDFVYCNINQSAGWLNFAGTTSFGGNVSISGGSFDHDGGTRTVNITGNLSMSSGYLGYGNGPSEITVSGDFLFSGGQIGQTTTSLGPVTINGNTLISGTALKSIYGRNLVINNSGTWSGGDIHVTYNAKVTVAAGATLNVDLTAAKSIYESYGFPQSSFDNFGTIQLNGTALMNMSASQGLLFNNTGQVMVNGGELRLASTTNQSGCNYQLADGSTLNFAKGTTTGLHGNMITTTGNWNLLVSGATVTLSGGTFDVAGFTQSGGTLQGTADVNIAGNATMSAGYYGVTGTTDIGGNSTITEGSFDHNSGTRTVSIAGNLSMSGGFLGYGTGTSNITVGGDFAFSGGQIGQTTTSLGPVTINGNTLITGTALKLIYGRNLIINHSGTWSGGDINVSYNGKVTVASGATLNIDLASAKSIYESNGYPQSSLDNFGTIQLNGTALMNLSQYQGLLFNNSGQVNVNGGELRLASTINQSGSNYQLAGSSTLNFAKGTTNGLHGNLISGNGSWNLVVTGATVNVTGGTFSPANYTQSSGTLRGTASVNIAGNVTMSGGYYGVTGTTQIGGNVTITGGSFDDITGDRTVNITGNLSMSNGYLGYGIGNSNINVGGDFTFSGGQIGQTTTSLGTVIINGNTMISGTALKLIYGRNLIINHSGTWSGGDINVSYNGKVTVASGATLNIDLASAKSIYESNGYPQSSFDNFGTIQLNGTALMNLSLYQGLLFNNSGQIIISGGELRMKNTTSSGTFKGTGLLNFTVTLTQSGTISPGLSPGILTVNGAQPLSATSTLEIEMNNGSGAGSGHSQMQRSGNLTLNGKLRVIETGEVPNGTYIIVSLTSGTINGNFASAELPGGYTYNVTPTSVSVTKNVYSIACPTSRTVTAPAGQCSMAVSHIDAAVPGNEPYTYTLIGATSGSGSGTASGLSFNSGITTVTYALESNPAENCSFTVTVNTNVIPSVSITASTNDICVGNMVTFTAVPVNGGTPTYQWKVNGQNVGENSPVLNINTLNDGDIVTVEMTSSLFCATPLAVVSNAITVTVIEPVPPVVTITPSASQICEGGSVTFTAVPEYGGSAPAYQWKVNGQNAGTNNPVFTATGLNNGDTVSVVMTSSFPCATPATAQSNEIVMTVLPWTLPSVTITASVTEICAGSPVVFTATPGVGGNHTYQWRRNNSNVGTNSSVFETNTLQHNDQVYVLISSDLPCMQNPAPSNTITMTVNPLPVVTISGADQFCEGGSTILTASQGVSYLWNTGANTQSITITEPGTYSVTVTDVKGCQGTGSKVVKPVPLPVGTFALQAPADSSFSVVDPVFFSWTAASQAAFYDLYIWRTNQTRPVTPTVTGITGTSHTYAPYLNKNFIYNWQIVARNLCFQVESPVRLFAFNVFSDLTVTSVSAPAAAMTGQTLPVTFTVANTGTGGTGIIPWKDEIYLSPTVTFDQATAIKMATVNNLSSLNPDQHYENTVSLIIPENLEGTWYPFVRTDLNNIIQEINENNNLAGSEAAITISLPPYPDIAVSNIQPMSGNIIPGATVTVGWNVENTGNTVASGGWSQRVSLVSGAQIQILGFVQNNDNLEAGGIVTQSGSFQVPQHPGMEGDVYIEVKLIPNASLLENPNGSANNTALSANTVLVEKRLFVSLNPASVSENSASPVQGMIYRSGSRTAALVVSLSAAPAGRISFPATVTIPANQAGAQFTVSAIDNLTMDGNTEVALTAQAGTYPATSAGLTIIENELPSFTVTLSSASATEGDTVQLTVTRGEPLSNTLNVNLFTTKASQITLPAQITVESGETSATVGIPVVQNTVPELNEEVVINASAVGYVPVSDTLTVLDNDVPQISLTLNPVTVSEAAGPYASFGYVQLPQPATTTLIIKLSTDKPELVYFPAQITIPAGQIARQFNVGVVDNGLVDGDKTVQITASVFINSCGCSAPQGTAGASTQILDIMDNDGPSLSVASNPLIVPENYINAGMITITRNTQGGPELSVDIYHNGDDEIDIITTAVIPAGENSVQVPFHTIDDIIEDGDQVVTLMVSAQNYSIGACWIIVSDRNVPDYVAYGLTLSQSSMLINSDISISLKVRNDGFSLGTSGAMVKIYKSSNTTIDPGDKLLTTLYTPSALPIGDSVEMNAVVNISDAIGNYYLIANVNEGGSLNELININNTTEAVPLSVLPDYNATAWVDGDIFNGTAPITISGVTEAAAKSPAPNKQVDVYVVVNGAKRILNAVSDNNGQFSINFTPLHGEAGEYYIGACYPGQGLNDAEDEFTILGARHLASGYIIWDMFIGETQSYNLDIQNFSPIPLNNVRIQVLSSPPGCTMNFSPIGQLAGNAPATFNYTVSASTITSGASYQEVKLQLISDEGTKYRISAWFYSRATRGNLKLTPTALNKGMVRGSLNYAEFEIMNNGNDSTGTITVLLPQSNWMSMATAGNTIPSLQPGETADVTLRLLPGNDLQLNNPISGQIALSATNANSVALPFTFEPVSTATGSLVVDAVDEYTYNTEVGPHLAGASVTVSHPYTGQVIAQGFTNTNGLFQVAAINEGYYNLRVTASQHGSYQNIIYIEKGIQNTEVVFLPFQAITYTWQVVPTLIEDEYEITLVTVFETNVPAPVVTMHMPDTMPQLNQGQVFPFVVTLTNHGLITAQDVELTFPDDGEYMFTANVNMIDVLPNTSVMIPVIMERRPDAAASRSSSNCKDYIVSEFKFSCGPSDQMRLVAEDLFYLGRACGSGPAGGGDGSGAYSYDICWSCGSGPGTPPNFSGGGGLGSGVNVNISIPFPFEQSNTGCDPCVAKLGNALLGCGPVPLAYTLVPVPAGIIKNAIMDNIKLIVPAIISIVDDGLCVADLAESVQCKIDQNSSGKINSPVPQEIVQANNNLLMAKKAFFAIKDAYIEIYDSEEILLKQDFNVFNDSVINSIHTLTEIDETRRNELIEVFAESDITTTEIDGFIERWNTTIEAWEQGIFSPTSQYPEIADTLLLYNYKMSLDTAVNYAIDQGFTYLEELYNSAYSILFDYTQELSSSVCATVTVQFSQRLSMTREAFEGTLTIFNGHETNAMQNVRLELEVRDEFGFIRNDLFQINTKSLSVLSGIDGTGVLDAQATGSAVILFIPERGAAPDVPRFYSFGGKLSYLDPFTGEMYETNLFPVTLQVNPSPNLYIDYFMQRDILGDDALTEPIEPSIPAELAVMINNQGAGTAYSVNIESAQPTIIENEKGLLIDFEITGSNLGGKPTQLGLLNVNFGDIPGGEIAVGQWWFTSSLLGHFIAYEVSVNHLNSFGNPDLSLVSSVEVHELIKSVSVYGATYDTINDFLVNDIPDTGDEPDALYHSTGEVSSVYLAGDIAADAPVRLDHLSVELTVTSSQPGWNYARMDDPGDGYYRIVSCTREDGQVIPLDNIWLTWVTIPDGGEPVYENKLHFLDQFAEAGEQVYTVVFAPVNLDVPRVVRINGIPTAPASTPVTDVQVVFNKPINPASFNHEDMVLRNQAGPNLSDEEVVVSRINDTTYNVDISAKTGPNGYYTLTVQTTGITDLIGNTGQTGRQVAWIQAISAPAIDYFFGLPEEAGAPIDTLLVLFNMPVVPSTFTVNQLKLTDGNENILPTGSLIITPKSFNNVLFKISGLSSLTSANGDYSLTFEVSEVMGESGQNGVADQTVEWSVCTTPLPVVFAGNNDILCIGAGYPLSPTVQHSNVYLWTTSGTGTFDNNQSLNAVYTPGAQDIIVGKVVLTLSAQPLDPCVQAVSSSLELTIKNSVEANAGINAKICENKTFNLTGSVIDAAGYYWITSGDGSFSNDSLLNPVYTPGAQDKSAGSVILSLVAQPLPPCTVNDTSSMILTVQKSPSVYAGANQTVCQTQQVQLNATAQHYSYLIWQNNLGDGFLSDRTILNPVYSFGPNDVNRGIVILTLYAQAVNPCFAPASSSVRIFIRKKPVINLGSNEAVCYSPAYQLSATVQNSTSYSWTSGGDGQFSNPNIMNPVYTFGPGDVASGSVQFSLTAQSTTPCTGPVTASKTITLQQPPVADAGVDGLMCEGTGYPLTGTVQNASAIVWQTSGDGAFSNPAILNPVYYPGALDIQNGTAVISLTAVPLTPCQIPAVDVVEINIIPLPDVFAGGDMEICHTETLTVNGTISGTGTVAWITEGDGVFGSANDLQTVYYPGPNDILTGTATITLQLTATGPCPGVVTDTLILTINTCQELSLPAGWSGVSTFVDPVTPVLPEMLLPVTDHLVIMYSQTGIFWPGQNINTIGPWNRNEGYILKMSETRPLNVPGARSTSNTLPLHAGWNLIPVLSECSKDVVSLFAGTGVVMVKEVAGWNLYWPALGINTLGTLQPGRAYYVLMAESGTITFPTCEQGNLNPGQGTGNLKMSEMMENSPWNLFERTPSSHIIGFPASAIEPGMIRVGDFIGAFDAGGNCYGMMVWKGTGTSMVIFGDDPTTAAKDGFEDSELIFFRLYNPVSKVQAGLEVIYDPQWPQTDGIFRVNGISAISGFVVNAATGIPESFAENVRIYPNPAENELFIDLADDTKTRAVITDMSGKEIHSVNLSEMHNRLDIQALRKGIYFLKLKNDKFEIVEKIVVK